MRVGRRGEAQHRRGDDEEREPTHGVPNYRKRERALYRARSSFSSMPCYFVSAVPSIVFGTLVPIWIFRGSGAFGFTTWSSSTPFS